MFPGCPHSNKPVPRLMFSLSKHSILFTQQRMGPLVPVSKARVRALPEAGALPRTRPCSEPPASTAERWRCLVP